MLSCEVSSGLDLFIQTLLPLKHLVVEAAVLAWKTPHFNLTLGEPLFLHFQMIL